MRRTAATALILFTLAACDLGPKADPDDRAQVGSGRLVYETHCAQCHGINLEGQPNWRVRDVTGRLPAPPHDETGHTWHHSDDILFRIIQDGGASIAPPGFDSGMPAFGKQLNEDQIWAVLAFIKSKWPPQIREQQARRNK